MSRRIYKGLYILGTGNEVFPPGTLSVNFTDNTINIHNGTTPGGDPLGINNDIISSELEEDFIIRTSHEVPSSPPSGDNIVDVDFVFGTNGYITVNSGIKSTSTLRLLSDSAVFVGYQAENPSIVIGNAYDNNGGITSIRGKTLQLLSRVPPTSKGTLGDGANMVAFSSTHIYVCVGDYDGAADIWKRVALTGGTW